MSKVIIETLLFEMCFFEDKLMTEFLTLACKVFIMINHISDTDEDVNNRGSC